MENKKQKYVIGVDGGGTKTEAALADLKGRILRIEKTGPSNPRNIGIEKCILSVSEAIKKVKKGKNISSIIIGLPAMEEEFKLSKPRILKRLNFKEKTKIVSDQLIAFKTGTQEKDGLVIISGTGCVCHGWRGKKEAKASGWGWLTDEGSGFWTGQKGFQAALKELDGRGPETEITKILFKEWKVKNKEDLLKIVYSENLVRNTSLISRIVDKACLKGDKIAVSIMTEAGRELAIAASTVIRKLNFQNQSFPLVIIGGMFDSKTVLATFKGEVKKIAPKVKFLRPKIDPVIGAVRLAIENLK
jgi:N-acetylglucosamine kinase-like BadF-type ATPase